MNNLNSKCTATSDARSNIREIPLGSVREGIASTLSQLPSYEALDSNGPSRTGIILCDRCAFLVLGADPKWMTVRAVRINLAEAKYVRIDEEVPARLYGLVAEGPYLVIIDVGQLREQLATTNNLHVHAERVQDIRLNPVDRHGPLIIETATNFFIVEPYWHPSRATHAR